MELRLVVSVDEPPRSEHDVLVDIDPNKTGRDLVQGLHQQIGSSLNVGLLGAFRVERARWLPLEEPISSADLHQGERILLSSTVGGKDGNVRLKDAPSPGPWLVVLDGPVAGQRFLLALGAYLVGRGATCDIQLDETDESMSREHFRIEVRADEIVISDAGSANGTFVNERELHSPCSIEPDTLVRAGSTLLGFEFPAARSRDERTTDERGEIPFNRPPRVAHPFVPPSFELPAPPEELKRTRLPAATSLAPLVLSALLALSTHRLYLLAFSALTPMMALWSWLQERRGGSRRYTNAISDFRGRLAVLEEELTEALSGEASARTAASPPMWDLIPRALGRSPALWERRPSDEDFLCLRIGSADQPSIVSVSILQGGSAELRSEAESMLRRHSSLPDAPVVLDVAKVGAVGLAGSPEPLATLGRSLVAQAAVLHSPRDVVIAAAISSKHLHDWDWLKWLPHTRPDVSPLRRTVVADRRQTNALLRSTSELLAERLRAGRYEGIASRQVTAPSVLLILDQEAITDRGLLGDILADGASCGIFTLWLGPDTRDLPGDCRAIISIDPGGRTAEMTEAGTGETIHGIVTEQLSERAGRELALALAPVSDVGTAKAYGAIPDRIDLFVLLGMGQPTPEDISARWEESSSHLGAPLGATADSVFGVDLRENGPHGLVAGTTGSGKSELLQTLVSSLAASHSPARLTFLLIDHKGGAAFKDCARLPHTVGFVTDLDAHLTRRALSTLGAELERRKRIITVDGGFADIRDMESHSIDKAPPNLLILIDEFADLAKKVPEFVEGVVDVAAQGRSLGLHLILATQSPSGVVTGKIRANTNLFIALRTANDAESMDVLGVPDAATISEGTPGRAYAKSGGQRTLVEFQTASTSTRALGSSAASRVAVHEFGFGSQDPASRRRLTIFPDDASSELQHLVTVVSEASARQSIPDQPPAWLAPLPEVLRLEALQHAVPPPDEPSVAVLGLVDEPRQQRQSPFTFSPQAEGHMLVYGGSGSGKTSLLRTLAASLAMRTSPQQVHMYALDCSTQGLMAVRNLPHCGAAVPGDDQERVERLFAMLKRTIAKRSELFMAAGVSSLSDYSATTPGGGGESRIVVLLDGYSGFVAGFQQVNRGELVDLLPQLIRDGQAVGVHFAISAERRAAASSLHSLIAKKVVFAMSDETEYAALGIKAASVRGATMPPGRGFIQQEGEDLEIQAAVVGEDASGTGQVAALTRLGAQSRGRFGPGNAPKVESLPTKVDRSSVGDPGEPMRAIIGLEGDQLQPASMELSDGHFLVVGPYHSGRSTALATISLSIRACTPGLELHLLAPRRTPLAELPLWSTISRGISACAETAVRLAEQVAGRSDAMEEPPMVIVIDDGEELSEGPVSSALEAIVKRGRDTSVRVLAAAERQATRRAFTGWISEVRKEYQGLLLHPDVDVDGDLLQTSLPRRKMAFPPGRGFLVARGNVQLVQVAVGEL